jgi:multiple antibiotic resistance protein
MRNFAIAMVAIVNPLSKVPLYVQASADQGGPARHRLAGYVTGVAFLVLLLALLAGKPLLNLFSVDLAAFRVGGGIVILLVGLSMIRGRAIEIDPEQEDGDQDTDPVVQAEIRFREVVVPLAMPIIAGPGSISTAIVYSAHAESWQDYFGMSLVLGGVMLVVLLTLLSSRRVEQVVGDTVMEIVTRFLGLLLAGIAVQFMVEGLAEIFPAWVEGVSALDGESGASE